MVSQRFIYDVATGEGRVEDWTPPPAPAPSPYRIAKSTPWRRMTDTEADLITGAMQRAPARLQGIYMASQYLDSGDAEFWPVLHDMIATTLGSSARADELLAPET